MTNNRTIAACGGLLLALSIAASAHAALGSPERTMHLTFDRAVALPGVTLGAGTYIFERATPMTSHHVVRVLSGDRRRVVFQGFTELVERPRGWDDSRPLAIGEARPGTPQPILAWYPAGTGTGHRFLYR